jgi:hypothetical protein
MRLQAGQGQTLFESMCDFEHRASTSSDKMNKYLERNLRQKWETGLNRLWTRPGQLPVQHSDELNLGRHHT